MKKLWLLLIPLAFSPSLCKGQQKKVLEPALLECHYTHLVKRDTLTENDIHRDSMILRLGKRFTSFVSYYTCQDDSIEVLPGHARLKLQRFHARVSNLDSIRRAGISTTSEYLYKDRQKDSCYVYGRVGEIGRKEAVVVKEKIPVMKWMQQDSVKMVCGYRCRRATTSFRGRTYVAWYTPDLPFQEGPWKLCGLPGLILEAYDKDRHYFYSAAEIVLSPGYPVTFYNWYEKEHKPMERTEYLDRLYQQESQYPIVYQGTEHGYDLQEKDYKNNIDL